MINVIASCASIPSDAHREGFHRVANEKASMGNMAECAVMVHLISVAIARDPSPCDQERQDMANASIDSEIIQVNRLSRPGDISIDRRVCYCGEEGR